MCIISNNHMIIVPLLHLYGVFLSPTAAVHQWDDQSGIVGGRDLRAGGTWLGVSQRSGRLSLVTNFREVSSQSGQKSRGELVVNFLKSDQVPQHYYNKLELDLYGGFNMIFGDPFQDDLVYASNRNNRTMTPLLHGIHGLSNGCINDQWYKVQKGKRILQKIMDKHDVNSEGIPWDAVFNELLSDSQTIENGYQLPYTGFSQVVEANLSSLFIPTFQMEKGMYGTISQSVIAFWHGGDVEWKERYLKNGVWKSVYHQFKIKESIELYHQKRHGGEEL